MKKPLQPTLLRILLCAVLTGAMPPVSAAVSAAALADCDGGHQSVLLPMPKPLGEASTATVPVITQAIWLDSRLIRWRGLPAAAPGSQFKLYHSARAQLAALPGQRVLGADGSLPLTPSRLLAPELSERFAWFGEGITLAARQTDVPRLRVLHRGQLLLVQEDGAGRVLRSTSLQHAAALDELFAAAENEPALGATVQGQRTQFKLWAPTAQNVRLCLFDSGAADSPARRLSSLQRDSSTGLWSASEARDLTGRYYIYLVDVFVPGVGLVRNRVTDPYALSLTTDSRRTWIGDLNAPALKPAGWDSTPAPRRVKHATDMVIYELHVRDFSIGDSSVPAAHRGKYLAFTHPASNGFVHLKAMSDAGLTDVHLLPVFDLATVPEVGCEAATRSATPAAGLPADSEAQQATVMAAAASDCFNWGYDPFHFTAPEGSFATDAADGATRILEFRRMVLALHRAGLRVGMDVVYNHTTASGQHQKSVLDRIVPGYYQRLNPEGKVEMSTCCDNTATEHRMMAKLMIDSAVVWARDHRIDSFRFDLMGHQPRAVMERLQVVVDRAAGREVQLIGEGWNFGEVQNGKRFVQASQLSLNGSGIATFSDRSRDAARGGGCCDNAEQTVQRQGWLTGLHYDPNGAAPMPTTLAALAASSTAATRAELLRHADLIRVGLAGTLKGFYMTAADGVVKPLSLIDYAGQPAGYASQPGEVVNYVDNHDNQTLFDISALKLPRTTSTDDRARVQVLGMALTAFSQGIAYYHAGIEVLRSKSGDRNSYDSGDWFNRLDWSFSDNHWGTGLPPRQENAQLWGVLKPLLADPTIKPGAAQIRFTRDAFYDLLKIRASSTLFRMQSADAVSARLNFHNTGPDQQPTVMVGHLQGKGLPGANFAEVLYFIHAGKEAARLELPALKGRNFVLHPVHRAANAADPRPLSQSRWEPATGTVLVPPRTALVYVLE